MGYFMQRANTKQSKSNVSDYFDTYFIVCICAMSVHCVERLKIYHFYAIYLKYAHQDILIGGNLIIIVKVDMELHNAARKNVRDFVFIC